MKKKMENKQKKSKAEIIKKDRIWNQKHAKDAGNRGIL